MNTFDEIIQTKAYSDLSSDELEVVHELVSSEAEYNEMKSFYAGIDQLAISGREEVSVSVKSSLNSVFQAKHPGISQNWNAPAEAAAEKTIPLYNRTLFRVAALLVLSAGVITVWVSMTDRQIEKTSPVELTASSDSISFKEHDSEQATEPKKEFPLNDDQSKKDFTAASNIPKDENADQSVTVYSNATSTMTSASTTSSPLTYQLKSYTDKTKRAKSEESNSFAEGYSTHSTKITFGNTAPGTVSTGLYAAPKPGKQASSFTAKKQPEVSSLGSLAKAGRNADLNPGGYYNNGTDAESAKDYKPSIKTSDLLTLIEPSF